MSIKSIIKILVSVLMLGLMIRIVDFEKLKTTFLNIPSSLAILVIVVYACGQFVSSFKWWLILKFGGIDVPYRRVLKSYYIGMFVNSLGLGVMGGDLARGVLVAEGKPVKAQALASVVADRAQGLAVLAMIGCFATLFWGQGILEPWLVGMLFAGSLSIVIGWFLGPWMVLKYLPETHPISAKFRQMAQAFPRKPKEILLITLVSVFFHLVQIGLHKVMGWGVGVDIGWNYLLVVIPVVNVLATLPISWNGLGVREQSYTYFLVPAVLAPEQAFALGAMWLLAVTITSAIGGIVALMTGDFQVLENAKKSRLEAEAKTLA